MTSSQSTDPDRVVCSGKGLTFGYINLPIESFIDTRNAGPGELKAFCNGPQKQAYCALHDNHDGTFKLVVTAQDVGLHQLHIQYEDRDVPGSPFSLRVSPASLVQVRGEGLRDGLLKRFQGDFRIESQAAGPGEVKIRMGGPRGGYQMKTIKEGRSLVCRYKPAVAGTYIIHVIWSGDPVPGSPFSVNIFNSKSEWRSFQHNQSYT